MTHTAKPTRRRAAAPTAPEAPHERAVRRKAAASRHTATTAPNPPALAAKGPTGKLGVVVALMRRPEGATVAQMGDATGWQPHSVRGALAGSVKKKHGLAIVGEAGEGGRVYRIAPEPSA